MILPLPPQELELQVGTITAGLFGSADWIPNLVHARQAPEQLKTVFFFKFCSLFCCYCCCFGDCFVVLDRVSCNPSCPQTCWVAKAGLGLLTLRTIFNVLLCINHSVLKFLKLNKMQLTNLFLEDYKLLLWGSHRVLSRSRILYGGQLDGSAGKGDGHQAFWPEFHARSIHGGSRKPTSSSGLQSTHTRCGTCISIYLYI